MASELMDKELHRQRSAAFQRYVKDHKDELPDMRSAIASQSEIMSANSARYLIVGGSLAPRWWDSTEPYPYQGLFVSAFYFLEAKNQLEEANDEASWVSLTQAYYYLGMNSSTLTAHESAADAVKSRHANNSKAIRKVIVAILNKIRGDTSIKSGAAASRRVIAVIEGNSAYMAVLNEFDSKSSEKTKTSKSKPPKSSLARLYDRLEEWSVADRPDRPGSPYPDIVEAVEPFKRGQRFVASKTNR